MGTKGPATTFHDFHGPTPRGQSTPRYTVSDRPQAPKFQKGDVWVIPAPTRSYGAHRDVYLYYEVYNLKKDGFGQTRYKRALFRMAAAPEP